MCAMRLPELTTEQSIKYQVLSETTAMVGVVKQENKDGGELEEIDTIQFGKGSVVLPEPEPYYYDDVDFAASPSVNKRGGGGSGGFVPAPPVAMMVEEEEEMEFDWDDTADMEFVMDDSGAEESAWEEPQSEESGNSTQEIPEMKDLLAHQSFISGYWKDTVEPVLSQFFVKDENGNEADLDDSNVSD